MASRSITVRLPEELAGWAAGRGAMSEVIREALQYYRAGMSVPPGGGEASKASRPTVETASQRHTAEGPPEPVPLPVAATAGPVRGLGRFPGREDRHGVNCFCNGCVLGRRKTSHG
jgi:hypothetical protein